MADAPPSIMDSMPRPGGRPPARGGRIAWWARLRRRMLGLLLALAAVLPVVRPHAEDTPFSEYQVKSVWLLNFTRFAEWPARAFPEPGSPFVVGVLGRDMFGKDLERAFDAKPVKGRPLIIRRVMTEQEARGCHLLFVATSERRRWRDLSEKLKDAPVLTVGETEEFLDQGGIINFLLKERSVQIEVDLSAAQRAGVKLDAKLLKIAVKVRGKYE